MQRTLKKRTKIILAILLGLVLIIIGGWLALQAQIYQPAPQAQQVAQTKAETSVKQGLLFKAKQPQQPLVIFYPGAFVEPASYSKSAQQVAAGGHTVYIARFPLDLAVLGGNRAQSYLQQDHGSSYVIGGHSLGGVMASRFAKQQTGAQLQGVFFLASYPDERGRLDQTKLPVLSLTASRDGVLNQDKWQVARKYLPKTAQFATIKGGNHAGFGDYGQQKGDQAAIISNQVQQDWIATELLKWLQQIN
ncbi:alpha/beta hydrolase [Lapidilactobacillus wuchangensis]|uniref:alpha/beta hydrolase n=1 Tax=Lapidilactobacillus wuchangensis TaxID=2486001 RepID=UPI001CDD0BF0|nr:alpha/beta hydrolase [Lapidilactobacillus wuchangensis]